ncbi:MAG: hypothetical protein WA192_03845 [Candidatus Acidiferrales bacterium]
MFSKRKPGTSTLRRSVSDDWIAWLPREKAHVFDSVVRRWESSYAMMSVSLDDAFSLRARGELVGARQQVSMSADLLARLAESLTSACAAMSDRGRHIGDLPSVAPLNAEFFRGETAQTAASWNEFLHRVLFASRSRYFQKLRILSETLQNLTQEYDEAAEDVAIGISAQPSGSWDALECLHYDFNTCLREAEVVLKSFLRALAGEQVSAFAAQLDAAPPSRRRAKVSSRARISRVSA